MSQKYLKELLPMKFSHGVSFVCVRLPVHSFGLLTPMQFDSFKLHESPLSRFLSLSLPPSFKLSFSHFTSNIYVSLYNSLSFNSLCECMHIISMYEWIIVMYFRFPLFGSMLSNQPSSLFFISCSFSLIFVAKNVSS